MPSKRILRLQQVRERTGLGKSSIYAKAATEDFPSQIKLSARAAGWLESEIDEWITKRIELSRTLGED